MEVDLGVNIGSNIGGGSRGGGGGGGGRGSVSGSEVVVGIGGRGATAAVVYSDVKGRIVDGAVREGVGASWRARGHCLAMMIT